MMNTQNGKSRNIDESERTRKIRDKNTPDNPERFLAVSRYSDFTPHQIEQVSNILQNTSQEKQEVPPDIQDIIQEILQR